jgi:hypothetical protein
VPLSSPPIETAKATNGGLHLSVAPIAFGRRWQRTRT